MNLIAASNMAQQQKSGKPWSGNNPIPNIQQFVANLDKDKRERDRQIDEENRQQKQAGGKVTPHVNDTTPKSRKTVRDPTTGKDVDIEDVDKKFVKSVEDPKVIHRKSPS